MNAPSTRFHIKDFRINVRCPKAVLSMAVFLSAAILIMTRCFQFGQSGDLVLRNGAIYTGNPLKPSAQALAIRSGRILIVGSNEDIQRFIGIKTKVVDLKGRFACAGFNDANTHLFEGGKSDTGLDMTGVKSIEEMQNRIILKNIWTMPPGAWLIGRGWDQTLFPGGSWPNKSHLDILTWEVPIVLLRICGRVALLNSKALSIAGITAGISDPPGGEIDRNPVTGEPTGILKEEAIKLILQYFPPLSKAGTEQAVLKALDMAKQFGITTIQDDSPVELYPVYENLLRQGKLTCRLSLCFPLGENPEQVQKARERYNHPMLYFGFLKALLDGSMGAQTAYFGEPYTDKPSFRGIPLLSRERLNLLVLRADRDGFPIGVDAVGDEANRAALNAFALARRINGARDNRHRIVHAQVLFPEDIPRFKELNIAVSVQPVQCTEDMRWVEARIGPERAKTAYAWNSLLKEGASLAFGSEWPISPLDPISGIYAAVTRQDTSLQPAGGFHPKDFNPQDFNPQDYNPQDYNPQDFHPQDFNPQERITVQQAIDAYTKGSAYAEKKESEKGTLEKDKLADIVVLDQNLLHISFQDILKTKVIMTICGGKIVYQSGP